MVRNRRERTLLAIVLAGLLGIGWWIAGRPLYEAWAGMDEEIEQQRLVLSGHETKLLNESEIEQEYEKTQSQLTMKPHESAQIADFKKELDDLIRKVGMTYREFGQQEKPRQEEDFKVLLFEVSEVQATPKQLGEFLYKLENEYDVMDIEQMTLTNDTGGRARFGRGKSDLTVDMRVARLVEYTTAEKNEMSSGRGSIRR
ncbi:MAG: hypothetical protein ABIH23_21465 [bacterium]